MTKFRHASVSAMAAGMLVLGFASPVRLLPGAEYPTPTIREKQEITVDGFTEIWQLRWKTAPKTVCEPSEESLMCPCMGFAYGEGGDLVLERTRNGAAIDQLVLNQFFAMESGGDRPIAIVQHWEPDYTSDLEASRQMGFLASVTKRSVVQVMNFADYNHDGWAAEFYLQTGTAPCGKSVGIVIGVSKRNAQLHAFGTASRPNRPLRMQKTEWEALNVASGPIEVLDWPCGDHGSETETILRLRWNLEGIDGTRRQFTCPAEDEVKRLLSEEPL